MRYHLLFGAVLASPIHAQTLEVDPQTIHACFASTPAWEQRPECLGDAANICQGQLGGSTTMGITLCLNAETFVWDELLNREYKLTRASHRADDTAGMPSDINRVETLRDAQRAWIIFRDADCKARYARWQNGTIKNNVAAACRMTMTAARALTLRDMRGN